MGLFDKDETSPKSGDNKPTEQSYILRLARIDEEKKALVEDIKDLYLEAESHGIDKKALRRAYSLSKIEKDERQKLGEMAFRLKLFE